MIFLVDTNILLRLIQQHEPMYADARKAAITLLRRRDQVTIIAQNLIEFWAVATRPLTSNGLALSVTDTAAHLKTFQQSFNLLPDTPNIFSEWQRLVELHAVSGRQVHDARLVAAMLVNRVTHLLTFNTDDFRRYQEISVVNPKDVQ